MECFNIREDWQTIPDENLRKLYNRLIKRQNRLAKLPVWTLLPAGIVYGMIGWVGFLVSEANLFSYVDTKVTGIINYVFFALCGVLMSLDMPLIVAGIPVLMALYICVKLIVFNSFSFDTIAMLFYLVFACIAVSKTVSDLNFLRGLPNFPFDRRMERIQFEGLTRDEMVKHLERVENGGIYFPDYEKIFDSDAHEEIAAPPEKTEEYMQQYEMEYPDRDKKSRFEENKQKDSVQSHKKVKDFSVFLPSYERLYDDDDDAEADFPIENEEYMQRYNMDYKNVGNRSSDHNRFR